MADVFTVVFVILGLWLALPALLLTLRALWPGAVMACREPLARHRGRCLLAGLAAGVPGIVAVGLLGALPGPAKGLSALLLAGLLLLAFLGVAGLATHVGEQLGSPADAGRPWLATLRGAVCLELPATIPILGWFIIGPSVLLLGLGALSVAFLRRHAVVQAPAPAPAQVPVVMSPDVSEPAAVSS